MRLISQHVVFLEQALSDLSHHGDVLYRKKRDISSEVENPLPDQTLIELSKPDMSNRTEESGRSTTEASAPVAEDDSLIVMKWEEAVTETSSPKTTTTGDRDDSMDHDSGFKCNCNLLHEHSCPIDKTKSFDNQFNDWYHNLLFSMSQNCSRGAKEFAKRKHRSRHHRRHHNRQHRNIRRGNGSLDQVPATMNPTQIDQMEETLVEDETVYATCDVIPNRHISLILQQNVRGRINLWQRSDGYGAMHVHVQLSGFRVTVGERRRRETNLMPVEASSETSSPAAAALSLEHGFHVHTSGDLSRSCQSTGTHFNPTNSSHGGPLEAVRHAGDLGNIRVDEKGGIDAEYSYPYVSLVGEHSVVGKSLVVSASPSLCRIHSFPPRPQIHAQADDFSRLATGNSGPKIACCVIEKVTRLPFLGDAGAAEPVRAAAKA